MLAGEAFSSHRVPVRALCLLLFALLGCTASSVPEGQCVFDSDCDSNLVCAAHFCRPQCRADTDCTGGGRCRQGARPEVRVCVPPDQPVPCLRASDCDAPMVCTRDGVCQSQCRTDYDCRVTNPHTSCRMGSCELSCPANLANCDGDTRNGCESDVSISIENCGACGTRCPAGPHADPACTSGHCVLTCLPGFGDCDNNPANGCETDLSDPAHCGTCTNRCVNPTGLCAVRTEGASRTYACAATCDPMSPTLCGATCVDTQRDPQHCGRCETQCAGGPQASPVCAAGACALRCNDTARFADCDRNPANGCEAELPVSASHCGMCGASCAGGAHASPTCVSAACALACDTGFANCDSSAANGCEEDVRVSTVHCGMCGVTCPAHTNATAVCDAGRCTDRCREGFGDCDGMSANGCETDLLATDAHCGMCGSACVPRANASSTCQAGRCTPRCNTGFGDCDGDGSNGCEVSLNTSVTSCGACGAACAPPHATPVCRAGVCAIAACAAGFADCDSDPSNGCEVDTRINATHCGMCGNRCSFPGAGARCNAGVCERTMCSSPTLGDCDGSATNGCETDLTTSSSNCGACGNACSAPNAAATCRAGVCAIATCNAGFADCDRTPTNGCEVNLNISPASCGACGNACGSANGAPSCAAGRCAITCNTGFGDCDGMNANGCETNLATTVTACGACGRACSLPNATPACVAERCAIAACTAGFADCDGDPSNGCEVDTRTSTAHCGRCGNACNSSNGTATCAMGTCGITCAPGFGNCDGMAANGCEVNLNTSTASCGACGAVCAPANATPACAMGRCAVAACTGTFGDCDGMPTNGCETNLATTVTACGMCGANCAPAHATGVCRAGVCGVASCATGFGDCDGSAANGCETDLTSTASSCGACGAACSLPNASATCTMGRCAVGACTAGFGDCDGMPANGCETATSTSNTHCGRCGMACATGTVCSAGACNSVCTAPTTFCAGACVNTSSDAANCGACGRACVAPANATATCGSGMCGFRCNTGFADCDGMAANGCEVNLNTSATNCGACTNACNATHGTPSCSGGTCAIACATGFGNCDGDASNGCETDLSTTATACGSCTTACTFANATPLCRAGVCGIAACNAGFGNCDAMSANGCETNLTTSVSNCGACGVVCNATNGTPSCRTDGTCAIACATGFGNCDGNAGNGCETNLSTSVTHCGACGATCSLTNATATCTAGSCAVASCTMGFGNCDGIAANGCETNLNTTTTSCGACGTTCVLANATPACSAGACAIASCNAGFGNCDGVTANGCETNLNTTTTSCGACGRACSLANATPACVSGACAVGMCNTAYGDCDAMPANGCETNLNTTTAHCGACGRACPTGNVCSGGTCSPVCTAPTTLCGGSCVNLTSDPSNCRACGTVCPAVANATPTCVTSTCGFTCNAGFGNCDAMSANGCETNLTTSATNCGACGTVCNGTNGTPSCSGGSCAIACNAGFGNCDGSASNGCEVNLATSVSNCGACGNLCSLANATAGCRAGACAIASCNPGYGNCDGVASNGCETNLNTSTSGCGTCGTVCTFANASATCASGVCALGTCNTGFANCDAMSANGCEASLTATTSCGACGTVCATPNNGVATCTSGVCGYTCNAGYYPLRGGCSPVPPPRLVFPLSGLTVTSQRPSLRFALVGVIDGGTVQVCRDRACATVEATLTVTGTTVTPPTALSRGTHYWRAYGAIGSNTGLNPSATWEFFVGAATATTHSTAGTSIPDVNGDGLGDLVIGESYYPRVMIHLGTTSGPSTTASYTLTGTAGGNLGTSVSTAGDIDGNGYPDIVVGDPTNSQIAYYLASATGFSTTPHYINGPVRSGFGNSVSAADDINGDGYADVVVGACITGACEGALYVYLGSIAGLPTTYNQRIAGVASAFFGISVAGVGSVNNDDYGDVVVLATGTSNAYVYYGGSTGLGTTAGATLTAPSVTRVSAAGDVNNDGFFDVALGSPTVSTVRVFRGSAAGLATTAATTLTDPLASFGLGLTNLGDVNGDGMGDIVVGTGTRVARLYFGGATTMTAGTMVTSAVTNFASVLAGPGDTNGDLIPDLLVGAPDDADLVCQGHAYLYRGAVTGLTTTISATYAPTGTLCWSAYGGSLD